MKSKLWLSLFFLSLIFGTIVVSNHQFAASAGSLRQLTVDAGAPIGTIKSLTGTCTTTNLNADTLRQLGVTVVRTHDMGVDIASSKADKKKKVIFPDLNADPENPASYNFGPADAILKGLVDQGIMPYVRVGNPKDDAFLPEDFTSSDFKKYANIVRHIVMHYNKGWANGFNMGIKYWQVWNEPDLTSTIPAMQAIMFWKGTPEQFFELYGEIAKAIKAADPAALVGAPAENTNGPKFRVPFMKYVKEHDLPFDFFNYQHYDDAHNNPYNFYRYTEDLRRELIETGFPDLPIHLTEWGYDHWTKISMAQAAAFTSASLAYMQDASLSLQTLEVLNVADNTYLADSNGALNAVGYAFAANSAMQATPTRLKVDGTDTIGFTTLAGSAADEIRVLITNYEIPEENRGPLSNGKGAPNVTQPIVDNIIHNETLGFTFYSLPRLDATYSDNDGYDLTVTNLPAWASDGFGVYRYRIDDTHIGSLIDSTKSSGSSVQVSAKLPAPAVELIVIRANSAGPPIFPGGSPTPSPSLSPSPTPSAVNNNYVVAYTANDWGSGATVNVTIKNNSTKAVDGWTLKWSFSGNQKISNMWNASYTQSGTAVTVKNMDFNKAIPSGGRVSFGFNLSYSGSNPKPTEFTLNGFVCATMD